MSAFIYGITVYFSFNKNSQIKQQSKFETQLSGKSIASTDKYERKIKTSGENAQTRLSMTRIHLTEENRRLDRLKKR